MDLRFETNAERYANISGVKLSVSSVSLVCTVIGLSTYRKEKLNKNTNNTVSISCQNSGDIRR